MIVKLRIPIIALCLFIGIILIVLYFNFGNKDKNEVMRATIYSAISRKAYYFVLNSDGYLNTSIVERDESSEIVMNTFVKKIIKKKNIKLNDQKYQYLIKLADKINKIESKYSNSVIWDGRNVELYYKGTLYKMDYYFNNSNELKKLIDNIINLSPIPVKFS